MIQERNHSNSGSAQQFCLINYKLPQVFRYANMIKADIFLEAKKIQQ